MTIEVVLTEEDFRQFTMFDTFRRKKMWRAPAIFAAILGTCGAICFLMRHVEGAVMLGCVLLLVGLGMPISYFLSFFFSLHKQIKLQKFPKTVYTLELTDLSKGISVKNDREQAQYAWKDVYHIYRHKHATYLYMTPARAFILPHWCMENGREPLWELIKRKVTSDKYTIL